MLCFGLPAAPGCVPEDVTGDGVLNGLDLIDLLLVFETTCPQGGERPAAIRTHDAVAITSHLPPNLNPPPATGVRLGWMEGTGTEEDLG